MTYKIYKKIEKEINQRYEGNTLKYYVSDKVRYYAKRKGRFLGFNHCVGYVSYIEELNMKCITTRYFLTPEDCKEFINAFHETYYGNGSKPVIVEKFEIVKQ